MIPLMKLTARGNMFTNIINKNIIKMMKLAFAFITKRSYAQNGFFGLKAVCSVCGKECGLNCFRMKDGWLYHF